MTEFEQRLLEFMKTLVIDTSEVLEQQKQIKALLLCAHDLGLITHPVTGQLVALKAQQLEPQQVMDMVDPNIKVTKSGYPGMYRMIFRDTSRTPQSLFPENTHAYDGDDIYDWTCMPSDSISYKDAVHVATDLHNARARADGKL